MATTQSELGDGIFQVGSVLSKAEVDKETAAKFDPNEQMKALMLQVAELAKTSGATLTPAFEQQIKERERIMAEHKARKAEAKE
jgi:hypothetical protein